MPARSLSSATRNPRCRPAAFQCSRRIERPREWKLWIGMRAACFGSRAARRCCISAAARRVNVMARHVSGAAPAPVTRCAIRWVSVRVLPDPGPATISNGPRTIEAAARCSASRAARMSAVTTGLPLVATLSRSVDEGAIEADVTRGVISAIGWAGVRVFGKSNSNPPPVRRVSSAGSNSRITPYSPSYPASRTTLPARRRAIPSASSDESARAMSSIGTDSRIGSSAPSKAKSLS